MRESEANAGIECRKKGAGTQHDVPAAHLEGHGKLAGGDLFALHQLNLKRLGRVLQAKVGNLKEGWGWGKGQTADAHDEWSTQKVKGSYGAAALHQTAGGRNSTRAHTHTHKRTNAQTHKRTNTHTRARTHKRTNAQTHKHTHARAHTHTHTQKPHALWLQASTLVDDSPKKPLPPGA